MLAVTFYLMGSVCFLGGFILGALLIKSVHNLD